MNPVKLEDFFPIRFQDFPVIRDFLSRCRFSFCDYSPVNLFAWGEIFQLRWQINAGRLWIYSARYQRMPMPLGAPVTPDELWDLAHSLRAQEIELKYGFADQNYLDAHPGIESCFEVIPEMENADYVYSTRRMIELKGSKLAKKKNLINQFRKAYPQYRVEPLGADDMHGCFKLAEKWCQIKLCDRIGFEHESSALKRALDHFEGLSLEGIKVLSEEAMIAFSVFSPLNAETADIHFEKSNPQVKGAAQVINWETARRLDGRFAWINREQDLGISGLRQAKRSYDPDNILIPYVLKPIF